MICCIKQAYSLNSSLFPACHTSIPLFPTAPLLMSVWSPACQRRQTCRPSSTMAPPTCRCPGPPSLLSLWTSPSPPTQVGQSSGGLNYRHQLWLVSFRQWSHSPSHPTGNPITAVYAISANRPGYSDYFVMSPPSSYRSPSWMSYPPEPEDLPRQWNDTPVRHPTDKRMKSRKHFIVFLSAAEPVSFLPTELTSSRNHLLKSSVCDTEWKQPVARWVPTSLQQFVMFV